MTMTAVPPAGLRTFGERLAWTIDEFVGVKRADFARRAHVSRQLLWRWLQSENGPSEATISLLAKTAGVTPAWLRYGVWDGENEHGGDEDSRAQEETPEQAAASLMPDVSYLKPQARVYYERIVGSWLSRRWPMDTVERAAREFVAPIKGYSTLRKVGQGYRELTDEDQVMVLEGQAEDIEEVYGPDGIVKRRG